jgi:hypothetical protein
MPEERKDASRAREAAKKAKPNWRAVTTGADDPYTSDSADAHTPELDALYEKYFGRDDRPGALELESAGGESEIVVMEPKDPAQARRLGHKSVIVRGGRVIGEQG